MANDIDHDIIETDDMYLLGRLNAPELFAEGLTQIMLGYPNSRLLLHTLIAPKEGAKKEIRRAVATLTIPTATLIELANLVLDAARRTGEQLLEFQAASGPRLATLLADAAAPAVPNTPTAG